MTPCKRSKKGQNICQPETRPSEVRSDALLAAWHEYTGNKYSNHPCENFKAGWAAAMKAANSGAICKKSTYNVIKEGGERYGSLFAKQQGD